MASAKVIAVLKKLVKSEVSAMAQYRLHAQFFRNLGYFNLKHALHELFYCENGHSKELMNHILFLGGTVDPADLVADLPKMGSDVSTILAADFDQEKQAVADYNAAIKVVQTEGDAGTEKLLFHILHEEEKHQFWAQRQVAQIAELGKSNYLTTQMKERKNPFR
jgi:bacterioferritin